uniref:Caspase-6 n=1 Tax=Channa striata TaxID=64152 RepID=A0A0E3VYT3_CHASR|nr:caspase 6 precursor [Channa striata]
MSCPVNKDTKGSLEKDNKTSQTTGPSENLTETDGYFCSSSFSMDPAEEYKMNRKRRGLALIFNQEYFEVNMSTRRGTSVDRKNLEKTLTGLGFEVLCYNEYTKAKVLSEITKAATADHSEADCFLLAFMSHGEDENVYASDGQISIRDITAMFKGTECPSLAGKPKIFIWQACRGREFDDPVTACSATESEENEVEAGAVQTLPAGADFIMCYSVAEGYFILQACRGDKHDDPVTPMDVVDSEVKTNEVVVDAGVVYTLPAGADFIMCYSVAEGYYSHRETINGSWYIQDLCGAMRKFGDSLEFTELLTLVNRKVSMRSVGNCNDKTAIGKKQVPCFASMLTRKLYFRPKKQ